MKFRAFARNLTRATLLSTALISAAHAESLKIGLIGPLTGAGAPWGYACKNAMQIAADQINAKGGLDVAGKKYPIEIVVYDDHYKASDDVAAYNRFVTQDGGKFLFLITSSGTMALKQNIESDKIVSFTTAFAAAAIDSNTKFLFRGLSTSADYMTPYAAWLFKNIKQHDLVLFNPNDETGWSQSKTTEPLFKAAGFHLISAELYERTTSDYAPQLTKIMAMKPDVIDLGSSSPASAGMIVRQARDAGYKGRFIQTGGAGWAEIVATAGKAAAEGTVNVLFADQSNPAYQALSAEYAKRNDGQKPNELIAVDADIVKVLLAAIQKAGTIDDTPKIAAAIPTVLPMKGTLGDDLTYAPQQIRDYDYIGVVTDGAPKIAGKIK
jgi:branched-chain amino acid transport system substrate-binding protein